MKRSNASSISRRPATSAKDTAVLSRLLKRLRNGADLRKTKVRRVKSALRQETYFNSLKLDIAADRLARDLTKDD